MGGVYGLVLEMLYFLYKYFIGRIQLYDYS